MFRLENDCQQGHQTYPRLMAATVICLRSAKSLFMRLSCNRSQLAKDRGVHWSWLIARSCVNVLRRVWRHRVEAKDDQGTRF